ncbi:MAG: 3-dehydroquinate synthase, partial [Deltaproteobacteria bacterium]|nr:3-dehydroquinate synthase [Deltaproteobacteria bacterium]
LGSLLTSLSPAKRLFLISDRRVARLHGAEVRQVLEAAGFEPVLLTMPPGERAKSWPVVQRLARGLLSQGAHRGSLLIALGGGVVGDLTGFLASIFMRGLPFIQVPTTLLAMVDASIGGKTAINLKEGKNLLGTFHQPRLVASDPGFLQTLPRAEFLNGLAEVLKAAFIRDPDLLGRLAAGPARLLRDPEDLTEVIYRAAAIKAEVVAQDEQEAGLRRILNFGHTLGHGLEQASSFKLSHGRAVAWGMLAAFSLSEKLAGLPAAESRRGRQLIRDLGFTRRSLPPLDPKAVLAALSRDKKRQENGVVFVLLRRLGEAVVREDVPMPMVGEALAEIMSR